MKKCKLKKNVDNEMFYNTTIHDPKNISKLDITFMYNDVELKYEYTSANKYNCMVCKVYFPGYTHFCYLEEDFNDLFEMIN